MTLTLGEPGRSVRGTVGSNELYINNLKFILSYPIEEVEGMPIVSRMDLTKVIEPVLRPSRIRDAAVIDSVVLDPGHGGMTMGRRVCSGTRRRMRWMWRGGRRGCWSGRGCGCI